MEIAEVQDKESLERYLQALPEDERREVALRVAWRAAARVLPFAARYFAENRIAIAGELSSLPIFRAAAASGIAYFLLTSTTAETGNKYFAIGATSAAGLAAERATGIAQCAAHATARAAFFGGERILKNIKSAKDAFKPDAG